MYVCMYVCMYVYIYMGETPPGGYLLSKNFIFQFYSKKMARKKKKNPQICGGFSCFQVFFFFSAFFCLSFSSLPLLFDILKPKKVPTRWGLWHIYIYIFFFFFRGVLSRSHGVWATREVCNYRFQNKTPRTEGWDEVPGSVDPGFAIGLPFPLPEILEFKASSSLIMVFGP